MQTLKTAVVVVLLLVVFYGVYEMLNRPPHQPPEEVAGVDTDMLEPPLVDVGDFGEPSSEPFVSLPPNASTGEQTSPVPQFPSEYAAPDARNMPEQPDYNLPNGQPATSPQLSGISPIPPSTTSGAPGLQHNPYINQDVRQPGRSDQPVQQIGVRAYESARKLAQTQIDEGRYFDALNTLSIFYKSQDLTPEEHRELLSLLDPLAARVVYSTEHLVQPAHEVRRNETLMDIAEKHEVPWPLLQKINSIENPQVLLPGSELKIVTGPFRAEVDLRTQELTVFLGQLYAGRFPISIGSDPQPVAGEFTIRDKLRQRDYFSAQGRKIPAGNPANPYGDVWMDTGSECSIHGSPLGGHDQQSGCIGLSPRDADDVYSILSKGSTVRVLR